MLFVFQKKALRFIVNINQRDSCRPHFVTQKILTLTSLFILETSTLIFKNRCRLQAPSPFYNTRQNLNLPLPIPKTTLVKKSLIYEGRKMYNHLPSGLKSINTVKTFRFRLRKLLLSKAYKHTPAWKSSTRTYCRVLPSLPAVLFVEYI